MPKHLSQADSYCVDCMALNPGHLMAGGLLFFWGGRGHGMFFNRAIPNLLCAVALAGSSVCSTVGVSPDFGLVSSKKRVAVKLRGLDHPCAQPHNSR